MPKNEYECYECGDRFEIIQKFSDKPILKCKYCSSDLHKIIHVPGIIFKGEGWWVTDHRKEKKKLDKE
jgi:putative FmdB family regulatory protein